ncbi:ABC transporter substrate-binding protein [Egicoccus sp. AB-alg6-2]|uniref:ABC transporter substrate-binding protein n=1 Tax=Egicoccus sp. AB-alg6-2 TaxID=3242692 RepID=UPI00359EE58A
MKRSLWLRRMAAVTALALAAAACGGNGDDTTAEPEPADTEEVEEPTDEPEEEPAEEPEDGGEGDEEQSVEGDGVLNLGYILPESGPLAFLGPPQIQAVELAVADMNAAGGVLGEDVTLESGDEAGDATIASESAQRLIGAGVNAVVGAASSGMSLSFVDALTGAGVVQCSASNTSPTFTGGDYNGMYFRTAPTDALQGPVLAETIVADGNTNPAILARADDYGQGLMEATVAELEAQGATVAAAITYDPEAANFEAEVNQVASANADSVALIAFDEGAQILASLIEAGMGPQNIAIYGADGVASDSLWEEVDPNDESILEGMKGTRPAADADEGFISRFQEETGLTDTTYAAAAYDCAILIGLAAEAAGSDDGAAIAAEMVNVSSGDTECSSFEECKQALENGESIAYQTASGVVLTSTDTGNGEPESGSYDIWELGADGGLTVLETVESNF